MVSKKQVWGILAVVFGLILAGCPTDNNGSEPYLGPKSIKITGFNLQNAEMIFVFVEKNSSWDYPPVAEGRTINFGSATDITVELAESVNDWDDMNEDIVRWTGTGKYYIWIQIHFSDQEKRSVYLYTMDGVVQVEADDSSYDPYNIEGITNAGSIDINSAITILDFAKFVYRGKDPTAG
jgi:hypothetical protein